MNLLIRSAMILSSGKSIPCHGQSLLDTWHFSADVAGVPKNPRGPRGPILPLDRLSHTLGEVSLCKVNKVRFHRWESVVLKPTAVTHVFQSVNPRISGPNFTGYQMSRWMISPTVQYGGTVYPQKPNVYHSWRLHYRLKKTQPTIPWFFLVHSYPTISP
jgi:hypothetical protein